MTHREEQLQDLPFDGPEVRLAAPREDVRNRPSLARFDQLVDILRPPAKPRRQRAGDGRLTRGHEADEEDLIERHRV